MTSNSKPTRPIVVIKKKVIYGTHHGGAWKVAYADFVTAMMSLFIVLWLLNSTPQIKKAVAGYFNDPSSSHKETGTVALGAGETVSVDTQNVEKLKEEIQKAILKQADLTKLSKQIEITVTGEGLKIDLIEDKGGTFFESGSPQLSGNGVELLGLLANQLKVLPNRLLIEGHTDAQPYPSNNGYTNWELSSDRANSARRLLQQDGIGKNQISQVRGYADQMLRVPSNPFDPSNRRISLIVQWVDASSTEPGSNPALPLGASSPPQAESTADTGNTPSQAASGPGPAKSDPAPPNSSPTVAPAAHQKGSLVSAGGTQKSAWLVKIKAFIPGK